MGTRRHDLLDRLITFAASVANLCDTLPATALGNHVRLQLTRSASSTFANYSESQGTLTRKEFIHRLGIVLRELRETKAWLTFADRTSLISTDLGDPALRESDELLAIIASSIKRAKASS